MNCGGSSIPETNTTTLFSEYRTERFSKNTLQIHQQNKHRISICICSVKLADFRIHQLQLYRVAKIIPLLFQLQQATNIKRRPTRPDVLLELSFPLFEMAFPESISMLPDKAFRNSQHINSGIFQITIPYGIRFPNFTVTSTIFGLIFSE